MRPDAGRPWLSVRWKALSRSLMARIFCLTRHRDLRGHVFQRRDHESEPHGCGRPVEDCDPEPAKRQFFRGKVSIRVDVCGPSWRGLWRRGWDSNPRYGYPYTAFRVRRIRPLCHLSARDVCGGNWFHRVGKRAVSRLVQACQALISKNGNWQRFLLVCLRQQT